MVAKALGDSSAHPEVLGTFILRSARSLFESESRCYYQEFAFTAIETKTNRYNLGLF